MLLMHDYGLDVLPDEVCLPAAGVVGAGVGFVFGFVAGVTGVAGVSADAAGFSVGFAVGVSPVFSVALSRLSNDSLGVIFPSSLIFFMVVLSMTGRRAFRAVSSV